MLPRPVAPGFPSGLRNSTSSPGFKKKKPATFLTTGSGSENGRNESFQCSSIVLPGFFPNHLCFGLYRVDHNDHGITVKRTVFGNVTTPTSFKCNNLYIAFLTIS